jgi:Holliday junction resolvase RusA-like endonuclease
VIQLEFPIEPVPKGRPRFTRFGKPYTPPETAAFERIISMMARRQYGDRKPLGGAVIVAIEFLFARPKSVKRIFHTVKPDLDNLIKAVTDPLNKILWDDDSQVHEAHATKRYADDGKPLIRVRIESADGHASCGAPAP